jgi:adenine-specific DNA-methyltransferase
MSTRFFTNDGENTLLNKFKGVFEHNKDIEYLWAILSSKLATFFHFNHSPKATKGAFPKILVKDIREFPIPIELSADESVLKVIQKTLNLGKEGKDTATQERKLNIWVCRIYGLSYEEAYIIDNEIGLSREEYKTFSINDK